MENKNTISNMIKFDSPKNKSSIIKVIGVGGGGGNAVTYMYNQGIKGVDFVLCNTDTQALEMSPVSNKLQLGTSLTEGRGSGSKPEIGKQATIESIDEITKILEKNTKMLFVTAGMGGGTGTGGAPVIAKIAKEMGILTVGIVTLPFSFEGRKRMQQAEDGIRELRENVDTLLLISNDKLRDICGNLKLREAFAKADDVLNTAAKGIAEIITVTGNVNVDFEDVNTVMKDSGVAIMGIGIAEGENRAMDAIQMAITSPLLNDNNIKGAKNMLLYIISGTDEISMDEVGEITDYIQYEAGSTADIIWGNGYDESIGNKISITLIATGFNRADAKAPPKIIHTLDENVIENKNIKNLSIAFPKIENTEKKYDIELKQDIKKHVLEDDKNINEPSASHLTKTKDNSTPYLKDSKTQEDPKTQEDSQSQHITNNIKPANTEQNEKSEQERKERIKKLKGLSITFKSPEGVSKLEKEPAYIRRNVDLPDVTPSSESEMSDYTLGKDKDENPEIKPNNSFLHDNVD